MLTISHIDVKCVKKKEKIEIKTELYETRKRKENSKTCRKQTYATHLSKIR